MQLEQYQLAQRWNDIRTAMSGRLRLYQEQQERADGSPQRARGDSVSRLHKQ